ncbi:DUF4123 domain-containing protein [Kangiella spongicola]|uniref:DUF4123 domain-containing protein n=1 Tax=Kangiella spongicola TaxID=796379 RepID=A0A318D6D8_9GAMM|nr:DUF4123 domain-containing protein [Kangiella spongicola]PXF64393.1 hypothetical protein DL796_04435 [Kangiella spongicola]
MMNKSKNKLSKAAIRRLEELLFTNKELNTYAIIDAAKKGSIPYFLEGMKATFASLLQGDDAKKLAEVAPYIVLLEKGSDVSQWYMEKLYGNSVGFALKTNLGIEGLIQFWARKVKTRIPGTEEKGFFRYYDPSVLREYLPILEEDNELIEFMGTTNSILVEAQKPEQLFVYTQKETDDGLTVASDIMKLAGNKENLAEE